MSTSWYGGTHVIIVMEKGILIKKNVLFVNIILSKEEKI